jgi:hypothetical protein
MTKNQIHEWHERDEESGKRRYIRGYWNSRDWTFATLEPGADDWARVEQPGPELWLSLRDVLWRKYQRKRIPFKFIQRVDAILEGLGVPVPQPGGPEVRDDAD